MPGKITGISMATTVLHGGVGASLGRPRIASYGGTAIKPPNMPGKARITTEVVVDSNGGCA